MKWNEELSDYDWSVQEIDEVLKRYSPKDSEYLKGILLSLGDIENLEVKRELNSTGDYYDGIIKYRWFRTPLDKDYGTETTKWKVLEESRGLAWDYGCTEEEKDYMRWVRKTFQKMDDERCKMIVMGIPMAEYQNLMKQGVVK